MGEGLRAVALIRLPPWVQREDGVVVRKSGWGQVRPEEWSGYQSLAQTAPSAFIQGCAARWRELQKENGPLRGMLNGQLVSLPEDVYDSFIFREIEAEPEVFREAGGYWAGSGKVPAGHRGRMIAAALKGVIRTGMLSRSPSRSRGSPTGGSCESAWLLPLIQIKLRRVYPPRFYFDEFYPLNWAMVFSQWGFH